METFRVCGQDEYLCIPFVATVLRLADIIDFDPKRTPSVLFCNNSRNATSGLPYSLVPINKSIICFLLNENFVS